VAFSVAAQGWATGNVWGIHDNYVDVSRMVSSVQFFGTLVGELGNGRGAALSGDWGLFYKEATGFSE